MRQESEIKSQYPQLPQSKSNRSTFLKSALISIGSPESEALLPRSYFEVGLADSQDFGESSFSVDPRISRTRRPIAFVSSRTSSDF